MVLLGRLRFIGWKVLGKAILFNADCGKAESFQSDSSACRESLYKGAALEAPGGFLVVPIGLREGDEPLR